MIALWCCLQAVSLGLRASSDCCGAVCRLCRSGFDHLDDIQTGLVAVNLNDSQSSSSSRDSRRSVLVRADQPRIALSSALLVELLAGLYFAM